MDDRLDGEGNYEGNKCEKSRNVQTEASGINDLSTPAFDSFNNNSRQKGALTAVKKWGIIGR
jgi:hypothetical protein